MKPLSFDLLRDAVAQGRIQWRKHVRQKLVERGVEQDAVRKVLLEQIVNDARARRLQVEVAALK